MQRHLNEHKLTTTHQRRMGVAEEHIIPHHDKEKQAKHREAHREQKNGHNRRYRETTQSKKATRHNTNKLMNSSENKPFHDQHKI